MGFMFCDLHVSLNNPSSGDINSSNLPCFFRFSRQRYINLCILKGEISIFLVKHVVKN